MRIKYIDLGGKQVPVNFDRAEQVKRIVEKVIALSGGPYWMAVEEVAQGLNVSKEAIEISIAVANEGWEA